MSRFPVERIKFSKNQKSMISILSDQVIVCKTHYDEDLGNFLCFGGACCDSDLAKVRYVYPIIRYSTGPKGIPIVNRDDKGKAVSPVYDVTCMALSVGSDVYQTLLDIQELKGSLTQFDYLITCTDDKYQKITVQEAGEARYRKDKNIVSTINEFWKENSKHILKAIARKVTPEQYETKQAADSSATQSVDFDEVFSK